MKFSQVFAYSLALQKLAQAARAELLPLLKGIDWADEGARAAAKAAMLAVLAKYAIPAAELGTQWFDVCAQDGERPDARIAGHLPTGIGQAGMEDAVDSVLDRKLEAEIEDALAGVMADYVKKSARNAVMENLAEDQDRYEQLGPQRQRGRHGDAAPGFCSVPTGETTCAYCIMQASRGYALYSDFKGKWADGRSNMWHDDCDCVVVPYADARNIEGYDAYDGYAEMYDAANDMFYRHHAGELAYPPDLQARIDALGQADTDSNTRERLVIMRYLYGLDH